MIALEGTKGTGKTTLFNRLMAHAPSLPLPITPYQPTAPACQHLPIASFLKKHPQKAIQDCWQEKLYAERARWHAAQLPRYTPCILADRSIATSYATRWQKWGSPQYTIQRTDALHTAVPIPKLIIWLQATPALCMARIAQRPKRTYGLHDQTPQRIAQNYQAYLHMMQQPPPRLAHTTWITLPAHLPLHQLTTIALQAIIAFQNLHQQNSALLTPNLL